MAGESLNRPDESKLSSDRFLLSPLVWLRQPAPIASACHGAVVGCENQMQRLAISSKNSPPKGFSLRRGSAVGVVRRVIRRCLWQIQADAAPMRQRVLQALAKQNDYAEL